MPPESTGDSSTIIGTDGIGFRWDVLVFAGVVVCLTTIICAIAGK